MRVFIAVAGAALLLSAFACGRSPTGPSGTLTVRLRDSPFTDAKSLLVTFSEVSAHKSDQPDNGWSKLPFTGGATTRTCDLKKLQTTQDILGTGPLTAGHYTQLRLIVSSAAIYFDNAAAGAVCDTTIVAPSGRSAPVVIPSGEVKLNREFDVPSAGATNILVDFNGDQSVRETGNGTFMMSPVIAIVSVQ